MNASIGFLGNHSFRMNSSPLDFSQSSMVYRIAEGSYPCRRTRLESAFSHRFSGVTEVYGSPRGTVILRKVSGVSRRLHDPLSCLAANGFILSRFQEEEDESGRFWKVATARNRKNHTEVRSTILALDSEKSWSSEKEWFWYAALHSQKRVYLAITEINDLSEKGDLH